MTSYRTWTYRPVGWLSNSGIGESEMKNNNILSIPVRVWEDERAWHVQADVVGVDRAKVEAEFFQDRLTIRYDRPAPEQAKHVFDDRSYGKFERVIRISDEIAVDEISAKAENGELWITLPKVPSSQPKKVVVS